MTSGLVVQTDSVCAQSSSCGACTASPQCGWCNGNGQCVEGNELGPFDSEGCNGWVQAKCPVEDITLTTSTVVEGSVYGDGSTEITDFAVDDPNAENDAYAFDRVDALELHIVGPVRRRGVGESVIAYRFVSLEVCVRAHS